MNAQAPANRDMVPHDVSSTEFVSELEDALMEPVRNRLVHPFVTAVSNGTATPRQIGGWLHQLSLWAEPSNRLLGVLFSNCPDEDLRGFVLENLMEEEHGHESNTKGHMELLYGALDEFEFPARRRSEDVPHLATWALAHWLEVVIRSRPFYEALAAVSFAMERLNPLVFGKLLDGLDRHYGASDAARAVFAVHASDVEEEHGLLGPLAIERYVHSAAQRDAVRFAAVHTGDLYYAQYECWAAY